jgi:hypothetical protein
MNIVTQPTDMLDGRVMLGVSLRRKDQRVNSLWL